MKIQDIDIEIESIKNQLIAKYQPVKVMLFGSASRDGETVNDLDFLIIKDGISGSPLNRMREVRSLLDKKMAADFIILTPSELSQRQSLQDPMITDIINNGRVLYGKKHKTLKLTLYPAVFCLSVRC